MTSLALPSNFSDPIKRAILKMRSMTYITFMQSKIRQNSLATNHKHSFIYAEYYTILLFVAHIYDLTFSTIANSCGVQRSVYQHTFMMKNMKQR